MLCSESVKTLFIDLSERERFLMNSSTYTANARPTNRRRWDYPQHKGEALAECFPFSMPTDGRLAGYGCLTLSTRSKRTLPVPGLNSRRMTVGRTQRTMTFSIIEASNLSALAAPFFLFFRVVWNEPRSPMDTLLPSSSIWSTWWQNSSTTALASARVAVVLWATRSQRSSKLTRVVSTFWA